MNGLIAPQANFISLKLQYFALIIRIKALKIRYNFVFTVSVATKSLVAFYFLDYKELDHA